MKTHVLVLGAGFGGLELTTRLSESLGDNVDVTLIDKSDAFVLGYSKLDLMFGHKTLDAVRMPYRNFVKPGVNFRQETITAIDPNARRITTNAGTYEADFVVVALGADYDMDATPGLAKAATYFTPWPVPRGYAMCSPHSRKAARSLVSAGRPTSARRRPANAP
jgi:sulfide:quinone oxidoreductase